MKNIDGIVELLMAKDSNFETLFNDAVAKSGVDIIAKVADVKASNSKKCIIKFDKDTQGVYIKTEDYNICVCKVNEEDLREVSSDNCKGMSIAYIKLNTEEGAVEYRYILTKNGNNYDLLPAIVKQGYTSSTSSISIELTDEDIKILKGEKALSL